MTPGVIAVTSGDPAGIGPEITVKALSRLKDEKTTFIVIGCEKFYSTFSKRLGKIFDNVIDTILKEPGVYLYNTKDDAVHGPSRRSGELALKFLKIAADLALRGEISAIVTAPVSKKNICDTGFKFIGHTEYLATRCAVKDVAMMFVGKKLKISLVSTHMPLKRVPFAVNMDRITRTIKLTSSSLKELFRISNPRIAVSGLNPHAGEDGIFGTEEQDVIIPAIKSVKRNGIHCEGPFATETIFLRLLNKEFDCGVFMYHDQALPAIKILDQAVNLTIGLPFIRTSPDHGTAFDIAGKFVANEEPMLNAIKLARDLASRKGNLFHAKGMSPPQADTAYQ